MTKPIKKQSAVDSIKDLLKEAKEKSTPRIQKFIPSGKEKEEDKRHFNKRPSNSGRKPKEENLIKRGVRELMDGHFLEEVPVRIKDPKTGQERVINKPRSLIVLDALFKVAVDTKNVPAMKEWFDRAIGKAPQPIRGDGDSDAPVKLEVDITSMLDKAYGDGDDD